MEHGEYEDDATTDVNDPGPEPAPTDGPRPWRWPTRFLFRFALVYFVLYALPFPFENLWRLLRSGLDVAGFDLEAASWQWMTPVNEFFYGKPLDVRSTGFWSDAWKQWTTWIGGLSWVELEVFHQRTGSGDTAHDWLKAGACATAALGAALLWSLVRRRPTRHARLAPWLHLGARWWVAFSLLGYGMVKFYAGQFSYPSLSRLMTPIGDTSPMGLVWTFMGFSKPYEVFVGIGETAAALLLFSRRTSLMGALLAVAVMSNVVMLNWFFDVPVKAYSSHLLLVSVALLLPDAGRLWRVFVTNRPTEPARLALTRFRGLNVALAVFGVAWVGLHLASTHGVQSKLQEQRAQELPEDYGVWEVEAQFRDGEELLPSDPKRWRYLAVDRGETGWIESRVGQRTGLRLRTGEEPGTLSVSPASARLDKSTWTLERGTKAVRVQAPAPRTLAEAQETVEVERPTLLIQGRWEDTDIEVFLVKKAFRLERGFHLVQELPYNR